MSEGHVFKDFVEERLAAPVGDTCALDERTIAECEEESQRQQQILDQVSSPTVLLFRVDTGLSLKQEETVFIKVEPEEVRVKQEEETLPVFLAVASDACLKTEETSLLLNSLQENSQGQDFSPDDEDRSYTLSSQSQSTPETSAAINTDEESRTDQRAEEKKYQCSMCGKRFRRKDYLQVHLRVHTEEKPYSCSTCEKRFSDKSVLNQHRRTHTGEQPYSCSTCEKKFNHKSNLNKHMSTHTGEKPYSCPMCEKRFNHKSNLIKHRRSHTGERPYSCSMCDKRFSYKSNLNIHRLTHSGEKPYGCSTCEKRFSYKFNLNIHSRTHTGEKPYSCSVCNSTFSVKSNLCRHERTHTRETLV